jgi:hypothetical protein
MIKPFKLLNGYTYSDEYTLPTQQDPPFNLSHRHWNLLPQDLRGATLQEMECYIRGWEDARVYCEANPYHDRVRSQLWNRGWNAWWARRNRDIEPVEPERELVTRDMIHYHADREYMNRHNRRTRVYTERDMEYYHTEEFLFFDVSEVRYNMVDGFPYKVMLFRSIEEGNTVEGQTIYPDHYMYNFPDVI